MTMEQPYSLKPSIATIMIISIILLFHVIAISVAAAQTQQIQTQQFQQINIVFGSANPNNGRFYDPSSITVQAGTRVGWTNYDDSLHTVTFVTPGIFDSGIIPPHLSASNVFFKSGNYNYYCTIHPYMIGQLIVS